MFFDKCVRRMRDFRDIPADTLRGIHSPALIIARDADVMRPEQAVEEYRLIAHSRLAILPGTDHMTLTSPHCMACADDQRLPQCFAK
jgi:pimeloyl-ACP methyl ester carboxylesterase